MTADQILLKLWLVCKIFIHILVWTHTAGYRPVSFWSTQVEPGAVGVLRSAWVRACVHLICRWAGGASGYSSVPTCSRLLCCHVNSLSFVRWAGIKFQVSDSLQINSDWSQAAGLLSHKNIQINIKHSVVSPLTSQSITQVVTLLQYFQFQLLHIHLITFVTRHFTDFIFKQIDFFINQIKSVMIDQLTQFIHTCKYMEIDHI